MTHDQVYGLHIVGTFLLWLGMLGATFTSLRAVVLPADQQVSWWKSARGFQWLIPIGSLSLTLSGIGLLMEGWGWFLGWLDISILATVLSIPFVLFRLAPAFRKVQEAAANGKPLAGVKTTGYSLKLLPPRLSAYFYQLYALLILATALMLLKPGTPMATLVAAAALAITWIMQPRH